MAGMGLSPRVVLKAATLENAKLLGLEDHVGTIEVGKTANLLLLDRNPLESVHAFESINKIILHGVVIDRAALSAQAPRSEVAAVAHD